MRALLIFISILITATAVPDYEQWISFKNKYGKTYRSLREESLRFKIFQNNLQKISVHNARFEQGEETYMMGVNQFADLSEDEFKQKLPLSDFQDHQPEVIFSAIPDVHGANSIDWREKGAVLDVEDQGFCGSCWAFSTIGSVEGQNAIKKNIKIPLSPQELVDCIHTMATWGCKGGEIYEGFKYIRDHGISALKEYKYDGHTETCKNLTTPRIEVNVTGYTSIAKNEEALRQAVEKVGPISITINAEPMHLYKSGILNPVECKKYNNHAILIVGYGTENGTDYWIMKNSWGKKWGEDGYFRIIRNKDGMCGLALHALYPNIV